MDDPIDIIYGKLRDSKVIDTTNYSVDKFRSWLSQNPDNSATIYSKLQDNDIIDTTNYSFDKFNSWLGIKPTTPAVPVATEDDMNRIRQKSRVIDDNIATENNKTTKQDAFNSAMSMGATANDNSRRNTTERVSAIRNAIVEDGPAKYTPEQVSELLYGDKDKNILTNAKNAANNDHETMLAAFGKSLKNISLSSLNPLSRLASDVKSVKDAQVQPDVIEYNVKNKQLAEYNNLLDQSLNKTVKDLGDPEALKKFLEIDEALMDGKELSPEEQDFYIKQKDLIKDPNFLHTLDAKRKVREEMINAPKEHKQAFLYNMLEDQDRQKLEKRLHNGVTRTIYELGKVFDAAPGALVSDLYTSGLAATDHVEALGILGSGDQGYWQKTSKQLRPANEDVATVKFNNKEYEVAFDSSGKVYNIYDDSGNDARLDQDQTSKLMEELNRQNPTHQTKHIRNLEGEIVNGLGSLSEMIGTMAISAGIGGAIGKALAFGAEGGALPYQSLLGDVLGSKVGSFLAPRVIESIPVMAQFLGTYAKQAISEGGIIDPDKVFNYGLEGAGIEAFTEIINPIAGSIGARFINTEKKFSKKLIEGAIGVSSPWYTRAAKYLKGVAINTGEEIGEELISNPLQYALNEHYNNKFKAGFDNPDPMTWDTISDTAITTAAASIIPALFGASSDVKTNKSQFIRQALFTSLKNPEKAEKVFEAYRSTIKPDQVKEFDNFKKLYDSTKDKSKEFITGEYQNASNDIKEEVFHTNFEISRLEDKKDEKSVKERERLAANVHELSLITKYNADTDYRIVGDNKMDLLDKLDEVMATKDLSKLTPKTIGEIYNTELSKFIADPNLKAKDVVDSIHKDLINNFNQVINSKIKEQREKYSLEEIQNNLLGSQDLFSDSFKLPKASKELYIKNAIKETKRIEENAAREKQLQELATKKQQKEVIRQLLKEGDSIQDKATGKQYTFRGFDGDLPILEDTEGNRLQHVEGEHISMPHLIETLPTNYDIIRAAPKEAPTSFTINSGSNTGMSGNTKVLSKVGKIEHGTLTTTLNGAIDPELDVKYTDYTNPHDLTESYSNIAHLGLTYEEVVDDEGNIQRVTNSQIVSEKSTQLLDKDKFKAGTKLTAKVNDSDSTPIYDPESRDVKETTWGKLKERLKAKGFLTTFSGLVVTYEDLVPIDLYKDGEKISGNIHTKVWVDKNANSQTKESELSKISALRKSIVKEGNTDLIITNYIDGYLNIGEFKPLDPDIPIILDKGQVKVNTTTGQVRINLDLLDTPAVDSIMTAIKLAFGLEDNPQLVSSLKKKGIDVNNKISLEEYISNFTYVEKPANSNFTKVVQDKANKYFDKTSTTSLEVNLDNESDLGFSILLGKTYEGSSTFTITKLTKQGGRVISQTFFKGELTTSKKPIGETLLDIENTLYTKKTAYKKTSEIHLIQDGKIVSQEYQSYIRPHLISNLNFTKVGDSYSVHYQPIISIELEEGKKKEEARKESSIEDFISPSDFSPYTEKEIGSYLSDYVIDGISEKFFTDISTAILGPVYNELLEKKTLNKADFKDALQFSSDTHKALFEKLNFKTEDLILIKKNILDNWSKIENNARRIASARVSEFIDDKFDIEDSAEEIHDDDKAFTKDVLDEASEEVKAFFSFIPNREVNNGRTSLLGLGEKSDFFNLYYPLTDVIVRIFHTCAISPNNYIEPSWENFKERIYASELPFKQQFVERAETLLDESKRNELVGVLFNSFKKMSITEVNGKESETSSISDEFNFKKKVSEWITNIQNKSNLLKIYSEEDSDETKVSSTEEFTKAISRLKDLVDKTNDKRTVEERVPLLKKAFVDLGITLSDRTYQALSEGKFQDLDKNPVGVFSATRDSLVLAIVNSMSRENIKDVRSLFSDNMFKKLAVFDLQVSGAKYSNTAFSGNKLVQTTGQVRNFEIRLAAFIKSTKLDHLKNTWFGKHMLWNSLKNLLSFESVPPSAIRNAASRKEKGFDQLNYKDHTILRLQRFIAPSTFKSLRGNFVTAPMEDKKNPFIITAPRFEINSENKLQGVPVVTGDATDLLIYQTIVPEILRILHDNNDTNIKGYNPKAFYMVPAMNKYSSIEYLDKAFLEGEMKHNLDEGGLKDIASWFDPTFYGEIRQIVEDYVATDIKNIKEEWLKHDIYSSLPKYFSDLEAKQKDLAIKNYSINYMIFHANEHLLTGDPALYWKGKVSEFSIKGVIEALKNKQKRLSLLNAAYKHVTLKFNGEKKEAKIRVVAISDPIFESNTRDFLSKYVSNEDLAKYSEKEASDAQMLTSAENYLTTIHSMGMISTKLYKETLKIVERQSEDILKRGKIRQKNLLPFKSKETLLNVIKTVIGDFTDEGVREKVTYIKMAEFPLIPQFTQGFELDKVRQRLEKDKIDKLVFSSGFKVGSPIPGTITHENGKITNIDITNNNIVELSQLYYGEQSANPQKDSEEVAWGSQRIKLMFANIKNLLFTDPRDNSKKISGKELEKLRDSKYEKLFNLKLENLLDRLTTSKGEINYEELTRILKDEIKDFSPIDAYLLSRDVIENKIPLWMNPNYSKIVPKLLAIVEKGVLKGKAKGKSSVQVFSDFFKLQEIEKFRELKALLKKVESDPNSTENREDIRQKINEIRATSELIFTDSFDGDLKSIRDEDGHIVAAQIFVPWIYKSPITNYLKDGKIDFDRVPKELLESIGFRIPTSGHNSVTRLEIVGFLPESAGNTILMPSDLMTQMGSDLDFDKLYSLFYNAESFEDLQGRKFLLDPRKVNKSIEDIIPRGANTVLDKDSEIASLENDLLDINKSIYLSDNEVLRMLNHKRISYGKLEDLVKQQTTEEKIIPLSTHYHLKKYLSGRVGKIGIGSFSIDNTFHVALQGTNVAYKVYDQNLWKYFPDGEEVKTQYESYLSVSLDRERTTQSLGEKDLKKVRYISDIYSAFQNASTDEGKEQLLQQLGITADTLHFVRGMIQTGREEDEIYDIVKTPIIKELMSQVSTYNGLFSKYADQENIIDDLISIEDNPENLDILNKYKAYYQLGVALSGIRSIMNLDSKGFEGSPWTAIIKSEKMEKFDKDSTFENLQNLLYNQGQETYLSLSTNIGMKGASLFFRDNIIPYNNSKIKRVYDSILSVADGNYKSSMASEIELRDKIFTDWVKFFYSSFKNIFGVTDLRAERQRLLFNNGLADIVTSIQNGENTKLKENLFISILAPSTEKRLKYVRVNNNQIDDIHPVDVQRAVIDLYRNVKEISKGYTTRDLVEDFYKYAFLVSQTQGPNEFLKYLPLDYIYNNPSLKNATIDNFTGVGDNILGNNLNSLVVQFFQHNPEYLYVPARGEIRASKDVYFNNTKHSLPKILNFKQYDIRTQQSSSKILINVGEHYVEIDKVGNYLHSMYDNDATETLKSITNTKKQYIPENSAEEELNLDQLLSDSAIASLGKEGAVYKYIKKFQEVAPNVRVFRTSNVLQKGKAIRGTNKIFINSKITGKEFYQVLAHEMIHMIDNNSVNPRAREARLKLREIYKQILDAQSPEYRSRIEQLNIRRAKDDKEFFLTDKEKADHVYAMSNDREFLAHFTHDTDGFRDWINGIDQNNRSWFDRIRSYIKDLIDSITGSKEFTDVIDKYIFQVIDNYNKPTTISDATLRANNSDITLNDANGTFIAELYPQVKSVDKKGKINYTFQVQDALVSKRGQEIIKKGEKNNWSLDKILTELNIPKDEKQLFLSLGIDTREKLALEMASKYNHVVEINTAKELPIPQKYLDDGLIPTQEYLNSIGKPTQHYSNLTVPGGTNYTENEISTPLITPSIKGHAQFSTDNGIGWFRSDEVYSPEERDKVIKSSWEGINMDENGNLISDNRTGIIYTPKKTRRILEVQSDWGQKQRKSSEPDINIKYDIQQIVNDLQKSGDLKIDCS